MATKISLFSTRPVNSNECQTHDHENEAQRGEARSLEKQRTKSLQHLHLSFS